MNWATEFVLIIAVFLGLLFGGMWIPFAIGVTGVGLIIVHGGLEHLKALGLISWGSVNSFTLTAIPLFILMAELLLTSGVSDRFYTGLSKLVRRLPGGLLQTNIAGCSLFAAISGSSVATAAAIGTVAIPQLTERKYDLSMSCGSLAAGGTLGILIPPSIALILYGTFTETSIGKLFIAGLIPGLLLSLIFMFYIGVRTRLNRNLAPRDIVAVSLRESLVALANLVPFMFLMVIVLGGIYLGMTTPTEAAAIGAFAAFFISWIFGDLTIPRFWTAIRQTIEISCSLLFIVLAAFIFSYAVEYAGLGTALAEWMTSLGLSKAWFLALLFLVYAIMGCVIDSIGIIVLTVPLVYPVLLEMCINPVWFGIVLVLFIELGQITPPLGINIFVIQGISKAKLGTIVRGTIPYYVIIILFVVLLTLIPEIVLFLPERMRY